ncbi:flagella synthesis protein FlgN [Rhodocyclus tenuis]|uniref:flagella synthesis protein FlgN n=1 Tax=Rhodocyclus tenuis TaxID=1066 RepID=UPI002D80FF90|nr:flagellar protein FlgN [Rhodocyclus tenuis]
MAEPMNSPKELASVIDSELAAVRAFVELLLLEQRILSDGDTDALPEIVERKTVVANTLSACAATRNAYLVAHSFANDRPGIDAWLSAHAEDKAVRESWSSLLALAAEARELNRLNGELIRLRVQHNSEALEALLGASRPLQLYGPDGQTSMSGGGRLRDAV